MKNLHIPQCKALVALLIGIAFNFNIYAQSTDCEGAIGVCSNGDINANSSGPGSNDFAGGSGSLGCIDEEHQTLWLFVQVESGNTLGFTIDPIGSDDYDFAVYGPDRTCDNLGNPIRCSWAAGSSNTGMNGSSSDYTEGAGGDGFIRWLNVSPGESYYILIDNYSSTNQGFTLEWNGNNNLNCDVALPCPIIDLGPDTAVCDGSSLTLGGSTAPGVTYQWSTGETTSMIDVTQSGTYWLAATKDTCTVYDTIQVSLLESPIINLGADTTLCQGESITLDATHPDATGYLWQDGSTNATFTATSTGAYTVEVQNAICSGTDEIVVTFDQIPIIDLGPDTILCDQNNFVLDATSSNAISYLWNDGSTNATLPINTSGTYSVIVESAACSNQEEIEVTFLSSPVLNLGNDTTYCEGDEIVLSAYDAGTISYLWQDGSTDPTFTATTSGTYSVEVQNASCTSTDEITLTFDEIPVIDLGPDTTLCNQDNFILDATNANANSYLWNDNSTNPTLTVSSSGTYSVFVSNTGCSYQDEINVTFLNSPILDLGDDASYCNGDTIVLTAYDVATTSYIWQDGSTESAFTVTESGNYSVLTSNGYCENQDSIAITFLAYPEFELHNDTTLCDDDTLVLSASALDATSYLWQDGSTNQDFTVTTSGTYIATASNDFCSTTDTAIIEYRFAPVFNLPDDTIMCKGNDIELVVTNQPEETIYTWQDGSNDSIYTVSMQGDYAVEVENQCGVVSDSIFVQYGSCDCEFYMPTAFTPNNDGLNDNYKPLFDCDSLITFEFEIFNRWGEMVYSSTIATEGWEGPNSKNVDPMDVYAWVMRYKWSWRGKEMEYQESGFFTIIK